jgi:RNA recognition motif-containing protein
VLYLRGSCPGNAWLGQVYAQSNARHFVQERLVRIYVGNLSYQVTDEELRQAFEAFGEVSSANVIMDKFSGQSKGFGFVEMSSKSEAEAAISSLNGKDLKGRALNVNEARPRPGPGGEGGGGGRGGGRGGGGGRPW